VEVSVNSYSVCLVLTKRDIHTVLLLRENKNAFNIINNDNNNNNSNTTRRVFIVLLLEVEAEVDRIAKNKFKSNIPPKQIIH
jgi:predicted ATPase